MSAVPQAAAANKPSFAELSKNLDPFNPDLGDLNSTLGKVVERDPYNKGFTTPAEKVPSMVMKKRRPVGADGAEADGCERRQSRGARRHALGVSR
jgi:hypothetical protein